MRTFQITNRAGLRYTITELSSDKIKLELQSTNKVRTLNIGFERFIYAYNAWKIKGELIQNAFPTLNASEREFIMTGISDEEWDTMFGEEHAES